MARSSSSGPHKLGRSVPMINPLKEVEVNRFVLRHPKVPEGLRGLTIAQITDVHLGRWVKARHMARVVDYVNASGADLVALTGDYIGYRAADIDPCIETLSQLSAPTYAVLGNHDHWADTERCLNAFERYKIPLLNNRSVVFDWKGTPMTIVGVDDHVTRHSDVDAAFEDYEDDKFCLTLNHVPAIAAPCAEMGGDLILSGHTHGFQFNIVGVTHRIAERMGTKYYAGPYRLGDSYLYISRGLGSASWPWRVRAEPELTFFELMPSPKVHLELVSSEPFRMEL
ncbi:hypothetical protein DFR33_101264 [Bradymonas sediminis]|uniref:Uncharacterized protein n=2 Tax=Bradymonas sediminis TaxID=1548548 RepID=A0A2Z4FGX3_9DELT|nr:hypothetical protein DN745_02355 [Bradymonas sediminis]TDP77364.1 hypothetical protein DFR33_101264 [Bradymonas sediminis]